MQKARRGRGAPTLAAFGLNLVEPPPLHDGAGARGETCPGCRDHPRLDCCVCGAPAQWATAADAEHAFTYCRSCWQILQAIRNPGSRLEVWAIGSNAVRPRRSHKKKSAPGAALVALPWTGDLTA
jgi:hypothetical protein